MVPEAKRINKPRWERQGQRQRERKERWQRQPKGQTSVQQLEQGEWLLSVRAACNFSHDGPLGGTKRKREGATSLPAKAVKKAKKEIMAMVIEEMKASEEVPVRTVMIH